MGKKNNNIPTIKSDLASSAMMTFVIISLLYCVFYFFGNQGTLDTRSTSLFGAILAFSGLMTKQYLLKENIEYLHKWKKVEDLIDSITIQHSSNNIETNNLSQQLLTLNNQASSYMHYIVTEIKAIPIIPLFLVVLYGAAIIASEAQWLSLICLGLMLFLVSYLAQATITSNNLAIDTSDLDETISELEALAKILREN